MPKIEESPEEILESGELNRIDTNELLAREINDRRLEALRQQLTGLNSRLRDPNAAEKEDVPELQKEILFINDEITRLKEEMEFVSKNTSSN